MFILHHMLALTVCGCLDETYIEYGVTATRLRVEHCVAHALALLTHLEYLESFVHCLHLHFGDAVHEHLMIAIFAYDLALH